LWSFFNQFQHLWTDVAGRLSNLKENRGAIVVQLILHQMENMDSMDVLTTICGGLIDGLPPPVRIGLLPSGSVDQDVVGSTPSATPVYMEKVLDFEGFFLYMGVKKWSDFGSSAP
jgi:hypothetical protein